MEISARNQEKKSQRCLWMAHIWTILFRQKLHAYFEKPKHTKEDIQLLKKRVSKNFPDDSLFIYGRRDLVHAHNTKDLARIPGPAEVMKAYHVHPNRKNFKPKPQNDGTVGNTSFLDELLLKIGAKVMMIHNVHYVAD